MTGPVGTPWREETVGGDVATWVVEPTGRLVVDALVDAVVGGEDELQVASRARRLVEDVALAAAAHSVATARLAARVAGHGTEFWTPSALEQASHPQVAAWRARRFAGDMAVVDLTAGCGADADALADLAPTVAIERDPGRVVLLGANLSGRAGVVRGDAVRTPTVRRLGWADPSRRAAGRRLRRLADLAPSVPSLRAGGWEGLGVAVSPATDLDDPDLGTEVELEFLQVGPRLVEATLWHGSLRERGPGAVAPRSATVVPDLHRRGDPGRPIGVTLAGAWLAVPQPALVRARLADEVAAEHDLGRVARDRALFWGDRPQMLDPWFRWEAVVGVTTARPRAVRELLAAEAPEAPVEMVLHGVDVDADGWRRQLRTPSGPDGVRVHLVRSPAGARAVVARAVHDFGPDGG